MRTLDKVTYTEAHRMLNYDPATGILRWKVERYRKHAGDVAGCIALKKDKDYRWINISINYTRYHACRVIWLMMTGAWPQNEIDHIDGDGTNNRWNNLRDVTHSQNGKNLKLKKNNTSGCAGVRFDKRRQLYSARIVVDYKEVFLGYFKDFDSAKRARVAGVKKYHGEFGRPQ